MVKRGFFIAIWTVGFWLGSTFLLGLVAGIFYPLLISMGSSPINETSLTIVMRSFSIVTTIIGAIGLVLGLFGKLPGTRRPSKAHKIVTASERMTLKVLTGSGKGRQITVPAGGAILGRDSDCCDKSFNEPTLSQKHCRIAFESGQWGIQDLDSSSGVIINGQKTSSSALKQGDRIELGALAFKVVSLPVPQVVPSTNREAADSV
jgi:hypothetical protein